MYGQFNRPTFLPHGQIAEGTRSRFADVDQCACPHPWRIKNSVARKSCACVESSLIGCCSGAALSSRGCLSPLPGIAGRRRLSFCRCPAFGGYQLVAKPLLPPALQRSCDSLEPSAAPSNDVTHIASGCLTDITSARVPLPGSKTAQSIQ